MALSGGNQQKLIVGKEMMADPIVLIAAQPTRGVDVGAQADIWDQLREARAADLAVLLVSADLDELIGLSDTLYVIYRGRLVAKLDPDDRDAGRARRVHDRRPGRAGRGMKLRNVLLWLAAPVIAAVSAIVISSIALLLSGNSPTEAFDAMWDYVTTADSFVVIINRAVPYYVAACAVAIGFKMNLFNIGVDGQYRLAALFAAAAGAALDLPALLQISAILLVAMVVGGAYAAIPGVLKVTRGVNEVVSTIMLNFIAIGITAYLLANNFRNEAVTLPGRDRPTATARASSRSLNGFLEKFGIDLPEPLTGFLPFAIVVGIAFYVIIYRTRFGFDLRTSGKNPNAARASGVNPKAMILKTMILSGHDRRPGRHVAAADRVPQVRRHLPARHRLHRHRRGPARPQQPGRDRRRGHGLGRHRTGLAEPELGRRAPGDRPDPPGHAAARRPSSPSRSSAATASGWS